MNKVNVKLREAVRCDGCVKVRELVEFGFLCSPVESSFPVLGQAFDLAQWCSICPLGTFELCLLADGPYAYCQRRSKPHQGRS